MARTPKNTGQTSRQTRGGARSRSKKEDDLFDEIESDDDGKAELEEELPETRKRQAKKTSTGSSTFQKQKNTIYAAARKNSRELSRAGTTYIEDARAKFQQFKAQESSYEKSFQDMERLCAVQRASIDSLLSKYPALLDGLAIRRSDQVNAVSEMIQDNPTQRQAALKKFFTRARVHYEESKENEKLASDASALIKRYKNLLYT